MPRTNGAKPAELTSSAIAFTVSRMAWILVMQTVSALAAARRPEIRQWLTTIEACRLWLTAASHAGPDSLLRDRTGAFLATVESVSGWRTMPASAGLNGFTLAAGWADIVSNARPVWYRFTLRYIVAALAKRKAVIYIESQFREFSEWLNVVGMQGTFASTTMPTPIAIARKYCFTPCGILRRITNRGYPQRRLSAFPTRISRTYAPSKHGAVADIASGTLASYHYSAGAGLDSFTHYYLIP